MTVFDALLVSLQTAAEYHRNDAVRPAAILGPDETREWVTPRAAAPHGLAAFSRLRSLRPGQSHLPPQSGVEDRQEAIRCSAAAIRGTLETRTEGQADAKARRSVRIATVGVLAARQRRRRTNSSEQHPGRDVRPEPGNGWKSEEDEVPVVRGNLIQNHSADAVAEHDVTVPDSTCCQTTRPVIMC